MSIAKDASPSWIQALADRQDPDTISSLSGIRVPPWLAAPKGPRPFETVTVRLTHNDSGDPYGIALAPTLNHDTAVSFDPAAGEHGAHYAAPTGGLPYGLRTAAKCHIVDCGCRQMSSADEKITKAAAQLGNRPGAVGPAKSAPAPRQTVGMTGVIRVLAERMMGVAKPPRTLPKREKNTSAEMQEARDRARGQKLLGEDKPVSTAPFKINLRPVDTKLCPADAAHGYHDSNAGPCPGCVLADKKAQRKREQAAERSRRHYWKGKVSE